jgi:hypothetical protein
MQAHDHGYCTNCGKKLLINIDYVRKLLCVKCHDKWESFIKRLNPEKEEDNGNEDNKDTGTDS